MNAAVYKILLVGLGGFIGSVLRVLTAAAVQQPRTGDRFPLGTVVVNLAGCFVIGLLSYLADTKDFFSADTRAFVFAGLLGGFTTFSTFGYETFALFRQGDNTLALVNVGVQVVAGLLLVWAGRFAAQVVWG